MRILHPHKTMKDQSFPWYHEAEYQLPQMSRNECQIQELRQHLPKLADTKVCRKLSLAHCIDQHVQVLCPLLKLRDPTSPYLQSPCSDTIKEQYLLQAKMSHHCSKRETNPSTEPKNTAQWLPDWTHRGSNSHKQTHWTTTQCCPRCLMRGNLNVLIFQIDRVHEIISSEWIQYQRGCLHLETGLKAHFFKGERMTSFQWLITYATSRAPSSRICLTTWAKAMALKEANL